MTVTRNCEYCHEPFTPAPGAMAGRQRFCSAKHRVYANREGAGPNTAPKPTRQPKAEAAATIIDWESLPPKVKDREAVLRRVIRKEIEREFESLVQAEVSARVDAVTRQSKRAEADARRVLNARKGIITRADYDVIRSCLHPDSRLSVSDSKLAKAFRIFNEAEILFLNENDLPTTNLPSMEDLKKRRRGRETRHP